MARTKTAEASLFSIASISSNVWSFGSAIDVSGYDEIDVRGHFGRGTGTALTISPSILIEGVAKTSINPSDWMPLALYKPGVGATIGSQAQSSGGGAGASTITLAAGTNFAANDYCIAHNTTIGNSEFPWVQSISGAVLTLAEVLTNSQSGATVRNQAERFRFLIDCSNLARVRAAINNSGTGQAIIVEMGFGAVSYS